MKILKTNDQLQRREFMRSRELAELGIDAELYRNDDGMLLVRQVPPPPVTITPEGDIDMGTVGEALEELPEALAAGASSLMQGATAATVGLPETWLPSAMPQSLL